MPPLKPDTSDPVATSISRYRFPPSLPHLITPQYTSFPPLEDPDPLSVFQRIVATWSGAGMHQYGSNFFGDFTSLAHRSFAPIWINRRYFFDIVVIQIQVMQKEHATVIHGRLELYIPQSFT